MTTPTKPTHNPTHRPHTRAFTLTELAVVLTIAALLTSLLIPTLAHTNARAMDLQSQSNLQTIAQLGALYANDHQNRIDHPGTGPIHNSTNEPQRP